MKNNLLIFVAVISFFTSCKTQPQSAKEKTISVTILPEKYFVESIAGDLVKVNLMIPPGASHSSYEPTAKQMNLLTQSEAYFKIGYLDFEQAWLPRFIGINSTMKIFDLSKGVTTLQGSCEHDHGENESASGKEELGIDPHIWMSARNVKIIATNILNSLISLYPEDSLVFSANYQKFLSEVNGIDSLYTMNAKKLEGLSFIIYHPALAYLANDYGMEQIVLEFDGKEPPPAHIREIIDLAREKNIHIIFVQKQLSIDNSRSLASEINAEIIQIDPLDVNWSEQMKFILDQFLKTSEIQKFSVMHSKPWNGNI